MWQEARKQERHIKTLMVDYKRRAERRRDYYERIKQDPIKFLRVYGRPAKLHLDSDVVKAAENPNNMMPWTGDPSILIDRFDARANLEHYNVQTPDDLKLTSVERIEERLCMYERYRCLIHNDYAGVTETMALKQIDLDEKYGDLDRKRKEEEEISKKSQEPKAAIGFVYEDSHPTLPPTGVSVVAPNVPTPTSVPEDSDSDDRADSDMDIDVELDLATLGVDGRRQLAKSAYGFGLHATDFLRLLDADQQLETELRMAKALEEEKLQLAGRKSRRARRILRERRAPDKFPKILGIKCWHLNFRVGLLNGQPISRRTVYLSASSSDSGEYPSDVDDEPDDLDASLSPNARAAALREQRAKAKPILTTARGPSVMIGGMTSIGLCRRRRLDHPAFESRSDSSSSSSSSTASDRRHRGRSGTFRTGRDSSRRRTKRSRVEYITTFGDHDDDEDDEDKKRTGRNSSLSAPSWQTDKPPGTAATAVAASVVSKLLGSERRNLSPVTQPSVQATTSLPRDSPRGSEPVPTAFRSQQQFRGKRGSLRRSLTSDDRRRHGSSSSSASPSRTRSRSTSSRSRSPRLRRNKFYNRRGIPGTHLRRSATRRRTGSSRDSASRNVRKRDGTGSTHRRRSSFDRSSSSSAGPSRHSASRFSRNQSDRSQSSRSITRSRSPSPIRSLSSSSSNGATNREPTPPIRRRYYRPELESDENSGLSDLDDGSENEADKHKSTNFSRAADAPRYSNFHHFLSHNNTVVTDGLAVLLPEIEGCEGTNPSVGGPGLGTPRITPQELLKRRVQTQLTKAFNADKKAELEKQVQLEQERQAREEGLRRQALLLRRQEEKRLREERRAAIRAAGGNLNDSDSSSSSSSSKSSIPRSRRPAPHRRDSPSSPRGRGNGNHTRSSPTSPWTVNTNTRVRQRSSSPGFRSPYRSGRLPSPPSSASSQPSRTGCNQSTSGSQHMSSRDVPTKMHPVRDGQWSDRRSAGSSHCYDSRGSRGSPKHSAPRSDRCPRGPDQHYPGGSIRADAPYLYRDCSSWPTRPPFRGGGGALWSTHPGGPNERRYGGPGYRGPPYRTSSDAEDVYPPTNRGNFPLHFDSDRRSRAHRGRS
ncbi:CLK4-associating serine/arginine rich protein [Fasciolopsis buskii]|uniref:CLK4-associating serine/arginine rich protein n=1 Tax=Fasciolopsis buskii TaxID=27845 RepID=A0A8E0RRV4_9TREM|nr:CLK4-associating serine/arginine rich protein [Fasciolopsis buski]